MLAAVAASPTVRTVGPGLRTYLVDAAEAADLDGLGFVDEQGLSQVTSSRPLGDPPVDLSDREYVRSALAGRLGISDALTSRITSVPIIAFAVPVSDAAARSPPRCAWTASAAVCSGCSSSRARRRRSSTARETWSSARVDRLTTSRRHRRATRWSRCAPNAAASSRRRVRTGSDCSATRRCPGRAG